MDAVAAQLEQLRPFFTQPHPISVAAVLAMGLFWARLGPPLAPGRPTALFGLVIGAAAYAPTQVWVTGEPTRAALDVLRDNIGPAQFESIPLWTGLVKALIAGLGEEIVKLLLMLIVVFAMTYPRDPRPSATAALAPAAGFSLFAANAALTSIFQTIFETGALDSSIGFPIAQQTAWVGLHFGTAYLLAKGWMTGRLSTYVLYAGGLHAAAAFTPALSAVGWHPVIVTMILAAIALGAFTGGAGAIPRYR